MMKRVQRGPIRGISFKLQPPGGGVRAQGQLRPRGLRPRHVRDWPRGGPGYRGALGIPQLRHHPDECHHPHVRSAPRVQDRPQRWPDMWRSPSLGHFRRTRLASRWTPIPRRSSSPSSFRCLLRTSSNSNFKANGVFFSLSSLWSGTTKDTPTCGRTLNTMKTTAALAHNPVFSLPIDARAMSLCYHHREQAFCHCAQRALLRRPNVHLGLVFCSLQRGVWILSLTLTAGSRMRLWAGPWI